MSFDLLSVMESLLYLASGVLLGWLNLIDHVEHVFYMLRLILGMIDLGLNLAVVVMHQLYWPSSVKELGLVG